MQSFAKECVEMVQMHLRNMHVQLLNVGLEVLSSAAIICVCRYFGAHFDDRYWAMFPMAKSMFFPQLQG